MTFLDIHKKLVLICFNLLFLTGNANSQAPLLLRATLGAGGASISVSQNGNKISFPQSIGQQGVTGVFSMKNLELRQGFIQPVFTVKSFHETGNTNISVYPNPFSSVVFVKVHNEVTGKIELKIVDMAGKPVYVEKIPAEEIIQVNLSSLTRGIYILVVQGENIRIIYKIIKH